MRKINAEKLSIELRDILIHRECQQRSAILLAEFFKSHNRGLDSLSLIKRSQVHDLSKMNNLDEFMALSSIADQINEMQDPQHILTPEQIVAISLHHKHNRHHREHFENPNDMSVDDIHEMATDIHARSKQFGNKNCIDYIEAQQEIRFKFDKDHYRRLHYYGSLLDDLSEADDYKDILTKNYDIGLKFNDKIVHDLEKFNLEPFKKVFESEHLLLIQSEGIDVSDFACVNYNLFLKNVNENIGFIKICCTGKMEFQINERYQNNGFAKEALITLLSELNMDYLYAEIREEAKGHDRAIGCLKNLGFSYEKDFANGVRFSTQSLEDIKKLRLNS